MIRSDHAYSTRVGRRQWEEKPPKLHKVSKRLNFGAQCTESTIGIERAPSPWYTLFVRVGHGGRLQNIFGCPDWSLQGIALPGFYLCGGVPDGLEVEFAVGKSGKTNVD